MLASASSIILFTLLVQAPVADAQVINGESTYGDSDLHEPPTETVPPRKDDQQNAPKWSSAEPHRR